MTFSAFRFSLRRRERVSLLPFFFLCFIMSASRLSVLSLFLLFALLAGCDTVDEQSPTDPTPPSPPEEVPSTEPVFEEGAYPMEIRSPGGVLYRQSRNEVTVTIPLVPTDSLLLTDGRPTVPGPTIAIVPEGDSVSLSALRLNPDGSQTRLRTRMLPILTPPRPQLKVLDSTGQEIMSGDSVSLARPVIEFSLDPDRDFAQTHPSDARYQIQQARVSIRKGLSASESLGTFSLGNGGTLNLNRQLRSTAPGDLLLVELQGVIRVNADGIAIPVSLSQSSRSFAFVLS